ncbi:MAG TPA: carboxypeptidase regulatory-like domain-containing protein, partial [Terriglobia bacterium]|nr:carboxypeptidase regulatory-like domain-containing protein [Terriglobia bacterium]
MSIFRIALFIFLAQIPIPTPATIQGVVLKSDGAPISGSRVELIRIDGTTPQTYSGTSGPDGTFTIPNVRPGQYRLAASRTGFLRREFGQRSRNGFGLPMNLEAGQQLRGIEIELRPAAAISGRVTNPEGDPMVAAEVRAMTTAYQAGRRILRVVQSTLTNDLGEYRLFGLPSGRYYVSVAPADTQTSTVIVNPALSIPLPNAPPAFLSASRSAVYYPNTTNSRNATPIDLPSGGDYGGANISFVALQRHHIRGNVPGGMARVTLVPDDPDLTSQVRQTDASGGPFDFPNVTPGEYTLVAISGELLGTVSVSLGDGDLENITVGLSPTVPLPTRVSFEDRTPGDMDPDLEGISFNLIADPPIPGQDPDVYAPFTNGFLAFGVLLRQDYEIALRRIRNDATTARLRDVYIKSIHMGNRDVLSEGLRVDDPDKPPQIEVVLGLRSGTLNGNVVSEKRKPEVNATVLLVPDAGRRRWADSFLTATTDLIGNFTIGRIPPGDYIAFSWEEVEEGAWMDPDFLKNYEPIGKRVHVNAGNNP